jgi:prepilin-type N-terminal cleavage/methylation domain-containing protein
MRRRRGFTLVELTVVIGVLLLLASLLIPMVAKAHRVAIRSRMKADIGAISTGLEAYRLDQRDYPRLSDAPNAVEVDGAVLLCWALLSPGPASQDGADGPGFRRRGTTGTTYGPYLNADSFRISSTDDTTAEILDRNDRPIHYCPSNPGANVYIPNGYVADTYGYSSSGPKPMYDHGYFEYCLDLKTLQGMLGDNNLTGGIEPGETPASTAPYLLWCAGPNGIFGPDPDRIVLKPDGTTDFARSPSDDVTNFTP